MMLTISGRHMELTPAMRDHAEAKAMKLSKYLDLVSAVDVVFDKCRLNHKKGCQVEMIASTRHRGQFIATITGDGYAAVDGCFRKLERLLSEDKKKLKNTKHTTASTRKITVS